MNEEDRFKAIILKLSDQVSALSRIVSKLMAVQDDLKKENIALKSLIHATADEREFKSLIPYDSEYSRTKTSSDLFQPLPIKLFPSSSPDFDPETTDDLGMSYFSSSTQTDNIMDLNSRNMFLSDTSPMMGYQEFVPDMPMTISPVYTSPLITQSQSNSLTVRRKFTTRKLNGPLKILIVDDDPLYQQLISRIIKSLHIGQCEVVADGVEAVINMSTNTFDLCLMDMQLPHLDGLQATQNIRKFNRRTPIVSMTARVGAEDVKKYFEGGIDEVLPKPFDKQSVKKIIQQFYKLSIEEE